MKYFFSFILFSIAHLSSLNIFRSVKASDSFLQPLFNVNTMLPRVGFFVSLTATSITLCYPVAIDIILLLRALTTGKVGFSQSELPHLHPYVENGSAATLF